MEWTEEQTNAGHVDINNSALIPDELHPNVLNIIAKLVHANTSLLTLKFMDYQQQSNNKGGGHLRNCTEMIFKDNSFTVKKKP